MRILVTGSRDWMDRREVYKRLNEVIVENAVMGTDSDGNDVDYLTPGWVIVHGKCPTGADAFADDFATVHWIATEPHPADWDRFGKRAGPIRNAEMVAAGADICLAFIRPGSKGAAETARIAQLASIETRIFRDA